jgi:NAD(P) transhydrogenase subunit alpha
VAQADVVITTAVVPGKKAPVLVTKDMVARMARGSVIVDLAAERGGNTEMTRSSEEVQTDNGVLIVGSINLATSVPYHASQMYARNLTTFLGHLVKEGKLVIDTKDEITRETLLTRDGEIVNERVRQFFSLPALAPASA